MQIRTWLRIVAPVAALLLLGAVGPARAAEPDAAATGRSTPVPVRTVSTEQVRAMAAQGNGTLITFGTPTARGSAAVTATSVTCYLSIGAPYGGGGYNAHIAVDGLLYCDDYVHLAVLTLELFRGTNRVANTTATYAYVSGIYATADYPTCTEGVYFGVVGVTVARYDLTPPSITSNQVGVPAYIGCASPPSSPSPTPSPATFAVTNPGSQHTLDGNPEHLQMTATGGTPAYTWSATGLPTGVSINAGTGLITGTSHAGTYAVTVTAVDATGRTASTQFSWVVRREACPRC